jgi:hypothetical protein
MQLYSNNRLRALALTLALVNLLSFANAQSRAPISYLSGTPNLTILYSWEPNCLTSNTCMLSTLLAGACCMLKFQSRSVLSSSDWLLNHYFIDNLRSAAPGGSPELFKNFNSWYGMGNSDPSVSDVETIFTCQVYASAECLTPIATYSYSAPVVSQSIASRAQSIRCGNWYFDPAMNTDYMLVIGKFRHCNNNWMGGSCQNVYPVVSRCCKFLFNHANFHIFR